MSIDLHALDCITVLTTSLVKERVEKEKKKTLRNDCKLIQQNC